MAKLLISRDGDEHPKISPELVEYAMANGLFPVNVTCRDGESSVKVTTLFRFLPQIGNLIYLEDGKTCEVTDVVFRMASGESSNRRLKIVMGVAAVYATLIEEKADQDTPTDE